MANKDDYLTYYREFFENFAQTVNPDDQLPVRLSSYKLVNVEVVGAIIDWTTQYLTQKKCPQQLIAPLIKIVIDEIRKACKKQPLECGFNPSDNAYEPLKLMQTVMSKINEICLRYLDNSMLCSLPSSGSAYFATSVCAVRNGRRKMEDRHVVIHDLNTLFNIQQASPSSYYAIFDGHAGFHAASYSSTHLHQFLAESEHFVVNPEQALHDAFLKTDTLFIDKWKNENFSSMSSSGTTAVVALLRPKEKTLYVAWVGDSQALLVNQGRVLQIVNPHKPSREDERQRIEKQGGRVMVWGIWRVDGQLAVSRAIGDAEYKPYVTAVPDIREIPLDGGEDFLILACDGLWDVVSEDCAARTVYNLITEDPEDTDRIGPHLVQVAKAQRSTDNISVIVVFLREPSKIAAEAHWANRNCPTSEMETTGLDNANNPFTLSNGANTNDIDNMLSTQKGDGLLLNLTDNFKQNGTDLSPTDFFTSEKSNGKRPASEFDDDDDFGPESNVDAVDDVLSPTSKKYEDNIFDDKAFEGHYNPFMEHQEKAALETEKILQKKDDGNDEGEKEIENNHNHNNGEEEEGFDEELKELETANEKESFQSEFQQQLEDTQRMAREETPTPPADTVHNVSGLVDTAAESESEDEWNYIKGEVANKENLPPQPEKEVAEIPEEDDSMSQLNPNAAEFVPVSPTSSGPTLCRLLNDEVISQSPIRAPQEIIDINLPNPNDFEKEVKSRPSEVDPFNGHSDELDKSSDSIDNLLNGKNIDEIPEFQPGSTPKKTVPTEEFHFGPNAVQFTPAKLFDQSEAGLSTRAVYGDESVATIGTSSFNESTVVPEASLLNKESDPMSMSFYEERDNSLFDLNKVQLIPDNLDEFLKQPDVNNISFNETISDLPEHHPLGASEAVKVTMNNDDAIQVTDLDKHSYDDEKELASPLEPEKELIGEEDSEPIKTPEPTHENLLGAEFCCIPKQDKQSDNILSDNVEIVSNDIEDDIATEVDDLLKTETIILPPDVEMIPPELSTEGSRGDLVESKSPAAENLDSDIVCERLATKSPAVESIEAVSPGLMAESGSLTGERPESGSLGFERPESGSLGFERPESGSLGFERPESGLQVDETPERPESGPLVCDRPESQSPICEQPVSKSPVCERPESKSPICERPESKSSVSERLELNSPVCERPELKSPLGERPESQSSLVERPESQTSLGERPDAKILVYDRPESQSSLHEKTEESESSICEKPEAESLICERLQFESPVGEKTASESQIQNAPFDRPISTSPLCERPQSNSPICERDLSSPVCPLPTSKAEFGQLDIPKSPIPNETGDLTQDFTSSQQIDVAQKNFEELCHPQEKVESPQEDVTSSVKDDISTPSPDHLVQQSQEFDQKLESNIILDTHVNSSLIDTSEPPQVEENVIKTDIVEQNFTLPIQTHGQEIDVKTDKITPEFAEQAVITPSEESKQEEIPPTAAVEDLTKETDVKSANNETLIGVAAAATALGVTAVAVATAKTPEAKVSEKKSATSATKKTTPKVGSASKPGTPKASPMSAPSSRLSGSKAAAPKAGAAKPPTSSSTARTISSATKLTAKPKTPAATPKSAEKKPLANGDIKSAVKSSLTAKKETTATKSVSSTTKLSPIKTTTAKTTPTSKPATTKTFTAPKPFTAKPAPTSAKPAVSAPKRPTTLSANKTAASSTLQAKTTTSSTTVTARPSLTKTSPKVPTAPRPKPATTTLAAPKPRVPLTKTVAKAPDTEKQIKESANKLTASKSATGTITNKTAGATRVVASSTVRKVESKTSATRTTVSKTTTTTMKSTTGKKPAEIVRNAANKTKTTKIEKPKVNGESTIVTEELTTVVHTTNNSIAVDGDPELVKDNSPLDNKLIIDSFVETNAVVD